MKPGFIGIGRIASAMIEGLLTSQIDELLISISPRNERLSLELAAKYDVIKRMDNNQAVLDSSDIIIVALPPSSASTILRELVFNERHTVLSLIPTLKFAELSELVAPATNVCRAIPLPTVVNHNCPVPLFNPSAEIIRLFNYLGKPFIVANEKQLHVLWTLTGFITPFYDLLGTLSGWAVERGVEEVVASGYVANFFQSISSFPGETGIVDFSKLATHAETPNGMNEQAGREIRENHAHDIYAKAANNLLKRFKN